MNVDKVEIGRKLVGSECQEQHPDVRIGEKYRLRIHINDLKLV